MTRFCALTYSPTSSTIYVNPANVTYVLAVSDTVTRIGFEKEHGLSVKESPEAVYAALNAALRE